MNEKSDQSVHEAIGWLAAIVGGTSLAREAHRANQAGCPGIAKRFLRLADMMAESPSTEWGDRRRQYADTLSLMVDLEDELEAL